MGRPRKTPKVNEKLVVYDVPMDVVYFDGDFNCRGPFSYETVSDLVDSIREHDLMAPITVQPYDAIPGFEYRIVAGHRRFRACQILKWDVIYAFIRELTERQAALLNFTENLIRTDLNVLQEGKALKKLYPLGFPGLRTIAKEVDQSERWVQERVRINDLPEAVQSLLASGEIPKQYIGDLWNVWSEKGVKVCEKAAKEIVAARDKSGRVVKQRLPFHLRKKSYQMRSRVEVDRMIARILDASIIGLAPRMGAWCAGYISDEELLEDIKKRVPKYRLAAAEEMEQ